MSLVSKTVTAENQFTDWIGIENGVLAITGTFVGTVTLQHMQSGTGTATDAQTFTAAGVHSLSGTAGELFRAGIKTGGYTSGTAYLTLNNGA